MHADYPLNLQRRQAAAAAAYSRHAGRRMHLPRARCPAARALRAGMAPDSAAVIAARAEVVPVRPGPGGHGGFGQQVNISARIPAHVNEMFVSAGQAVR